MVRDVRRLSAAFPGRGVRPARRLLPAAGAGNSACPRPRAGRHFSMRAWGAAAGPVGCDGCFSARGDIASQLALAPRDERRSLRISVMGRPPAIGERIKLAVLGTHPVQYFAPLFRALAASDE